MSEPTLAQRLIDAYEGATAYDDVHGAIRRVLDELPEQIVQSLAQLRDENPPRAGITGRIRERVREVLGLEPKP